MRELLCNRCGIRLPEDSWCGKDYCPSRPLPEDPINESNAIPLLKVFPVEPDHFTFPEDNSPDNQAGYGPINLNDLFEDAGDIIIWHDLITKANSYAQRAGISNRRVAEAWRDMIELRHEELTKKGKVSGIRGIIWRFSSMFMDKFQRYWYEGKLK